MIGIKSVLVIILISVAACSKSGTGTPEDPNNGNDPHVYNPTDQLAPVINISTPAANQVFTSGSSINMTGTISDDYGLYRGSIRVIRDANGVEEKRQNYEIHGMKTYNFNLAFAPAVTAPTDFTIVVFFEDHGYNGTTSTVKVKVNP